jgi:hypothetical protein
MNCSIDLCEDVATRKGWCSKHYQRWRRSGSTDLPEKAQCSVESCKYVAEKRGWCGNHYQRWRKYGDPEAALLRQKRERGYREITTNGYVRLYGYSDHPRSDKGKIFEHVLVMEQQLGRYLHPGENVHHKNGVRNDNRPENLELWIVSQPAGQRPEDLVKWAKEILERYDNGCCTT